MSLVPCLVHRHPSRGVGGVAVKAVVGGCVLMVLMQEAAASDASIQGSVVLIGETGQNRGEGDSTPFFIICFVPSSFFLFRGSRPPSVSLVVQIQTVTLLKQISFLFGCDQPWAFRYIDHRIS